MARAKKILLPFILVIMPAYCFPGEKPVALFLREAEPATHLYAMGRMFTSLSSKDSFYHPWSRGDVQRYGVSFSYWPGMIDDASFAFAGAMVPAGPAGIVSASFLRYGTGQETFEELDGTSRSVTLEQDSLVSVGYGGMLARGVSAGVNAKYLASALAEDYRAGAFLADAGLLYRSPGGIHHAGVALTNAGSPLTYYSASEPLASEITAGYTAQLRYDGDTRVLVGAAFARLLFDARDAFSLGVGYFPGASLFSVLAGVRLGDGIHTTLGLGIHPGDLDIDIGYRISTTKITAGTPLRVSLSWYWGERAVASRSIGGVW